jgi:hypothetical protein
MQIDIQHEIARLAQAHRTWKSHPGPLIEFGCGLLAANLAHIKKTYPNMAPHEHMRFTAASYNAGMGGATRGHNNGNVDEFTTGHNYGADVMSRIGWFDSALIVGHRPKREVPTK